MATFVLVHGTGHGGWCWRDVRSLLRAAGSDVYTPTLTGLSDRSHLLHCGVDLMTHVADVANLLFYEDLSDVVLVGHSYAGMVITGVAAIAPDRLGLLVYLDAYLPEEGQSQIDLWPPAMRAQVEADAALNDGLRPPPSLELLGLVDSDLAEWAAARMTPQPMATFTQPPPPATPESAAVPGAFIRCTRGPMTPVFRPCAERAKERGWEVRELPSGHDAMLIEPAGVAALLLELAGER